MDAWADVEGAIQSALEQRKQNIERLTALSAITILIGAVWLVWPTISSAAKGESGLLTGLGLPIIILIWGLMVQDLGIADARTRTRVSASATIAWPILLIIAAIFVIFIIFLIYKRHKLSKSKLGMEKLPQRKI